MVLAHHCRVRVECLGFRATHCLEWLWSRLTRASRCGPRASASSGLTAGGKCALSTWSQMSNVTCCIHSIICLCQKSLWHAFRATTSLTERKRKNKTKQVLTADWCSAMQIHCMLCRVKLAPDNHTDRPAAHMHTC